MTGDALVVLAAGEAVVVRAESEPPDACQDFAAALPAEEFRVAVVCTAAVGANPGLFAVLPAIVADHFGDRFRFGVRLVLLGGGMAGGVRAVSEAPTLAEALGAPVTVPLGPLEEELRGETRWVTCRPDGTSRYEPAWPGTPTPPPVRLRPAPTVPMHRGLRTAAGWSFATTPSAVAAGPALAGPALTGPLIEVDAGRDGFLVGGLPCKPRTFADLLAARMPTPGDSPIVVFGEGLTEPLLAELSTLMGVAVLSPSGPMTLTWSGVLTTTGEFRHWTPGATVPDLLGPMLPVPATPPPNEAPTVETPRPGDGAVNTS